MRIKEINDVGGMTELGKSWDALLSSSSNDNIFLTWDWVSRWWEVFGTGGRLTVLAGYDAAGALAGIAPLMIRVERGLFGKARVLSLIGSGGESLPDHLGLISRSGDEYEFCEAAFNALYEKRAEWDMIRLTDLLDDQRLADSVTSFFGGRCRFSISRTGTSPFIRLPGTWEEYLSGLSAESRYGVRRRARRIVKDLKSEFRIIKDKRELSAIMSRLEETHRARMSQKGEKGRSLERPFWVFHGKLAADLFDKGRLFTGCLCLGDKPAAVQYSFIYKGRVYYYQSGMDPAYARYGAGDVLVAEMIKSSIEAGASEYDFLRGGETYKSHWTKVWRNNMEIRVWKNTASGRAAAWLHGARGGVSGILGKKGLPEING